MSNNNQNIFATILNNYFQLTLLFKYLIQTIRKTNLLADFAIML